MTMLERFDKKRLFKSKLFFVVLIFAALIIAIVAALFLRKQIPSNASFSASSLAQPYSSTSSTGHTATSASLEEVIIKPTSKALSEERMWRQHLQEKIDFEAKKLDSNIDNLKQGIGKVDNSSSVALDKIGDLESRVALINQELDRIKNPISLQDIKAPKVNQINQYMLGLDNLITSPDYKPIKTSDNYIPSGSFAKAILLSGVDAITSLHSSTDPDPVLIRIIDHGTLPRRFKSDLKDCHVIGSSYGDLSSERAKIRLEKLSCTEIATGEIIETEVAGFVTGEDGRGGIRGTVVSTEGKLLGNSLLSGVLSGFSSNLTNQTPSISVFPNTKTTTTNHKIKNSMTAGTSTSLDRLSKYYIDRAESLQPIVQVGAGRKVDVIFTEGVFFGTSSLKREIAKKRDERIKDDSRKANLNFGESFKD